MEVPPQKLKLVWLLDAMDGLGQDREMPTVADLMEQIKTVLPSTAGDLDLISFGRKFGLDLDAQIDEDEDYEWGIENIHYALMQYRVEDVASYNMPTIVQLSNWVVHFQTYDDDLYPPIPFCHCTYVKRSTIEGAGYGLFALNQCDDNEEVSDYGGTFYESEEDYRAEKPEGNGLYVIGPLKAPKDTEIPFGEGFIVDGETGFYLNQQGRFANTKRTQEECNCEYRIHPDEGATERHQFRVVIVTTRPVAPDEELFVWYSQEYSDFIYGSSTQAEAEEANDE